MRSRKREIEAAIENGIQFLSKEQLESGEFKFFVSNKFFFSPMEEIKDEDWLYDQIVFGTSLVGNCLLCLKHRNNVLGMLNRALGFLESQKEEPGVWRWHGPKDRDPAAHLAWPPDLDDTAYALMFYEGMGEKTPSSLLDFLSEYKNTDGLFKTYMIELWWPDTPPEKRPLNSMIALRRMLLEMDDYSYAATKTDEELLLNNFENDINEAVNANVLSLFTMSGLQLPEVEDFLNNIISSGKYLNGSSYYPSPMAFLYFLSRAHKVGASRLNKSLPIITDYLLSPEKYHHGLLSNLEMAMSITSIIRFDLESRHVENRISLLLEHVQSDGGWKNERIVWPNVKDIPTPNYGSRSVSTAFCLEALQHYYETIKT
ncbi:MAG: hypothetical protein HPY65_12670 [Syntrophaceae bacterium]|nr:hypothetical protein [Syntrophaceae bacterium]